MASSIFTEFLNPEAAQGLDIIITETVSPLHSVAKYLHLLSLFFIAVGIITLMLKHREMKFEREYVAFSLVAFAICLGGIALPYFASALNTARLYHITLIFLAPFCVIGGITIFRVVSRIVRASWTNESVSSSLKVLSVFFAIFLLFNSGWVYEVAKDNPGSIALSHESIKKYSDYEKKAWFYTTLTPEQDVFSAKWLSKGRNHEEKVYATYKDSRVHPLMSYGLISAIETPALTNTIREIKGGSYVYLQYLNVVEGIGTYQREESIYNMTEIYPLYRGKSKIYTNGASEIYK
jgi:uncharacterized membrane protein